jgi:hypothetical protein
VARRGTPLNLKDRPLPVCLCVAHSLSRCRFRSRMTTTVRLEARERPWPVTKVSPLLWLTLARWIAVYLSRTIAHAIWSGKR